MASNTSHYNLVKPAYDESADIAVINSNMDSVDTQMYKNEQGVNNLQSGLAIVANGNTHAAISSGQFVYVKNHSTLSDGLYTANSNIAANATLSSTNLTANSNGGLNTLNDQIANKADTSKCVLDNKYIQDVTSDLNNLTDTGFYEYTNTCSNKPTTSGGVIMTMISYYSNQGMQIAYPNNTDYVWMRILKSGNWQAWGKITTS